MGVRNRLRRLDQRVLPPLAAALSGLGRGARRGRFVRIAAIVLSVAAVLVAVYFTGRQPAGTRSKPRPVIKVGVSNGDSIPDYVTRSRDQLATLIDKDAGATTPPRYFALVSLYAYVTPDAAGGLVNGVPVQITDAITRLRSNLPTHVYQLPATVVPDDVVREMAAAADYSERNIGVIEARRKAVTGSSLTDQDVRAQYEVVVQVDSVEAAGYRSSCACVYALVVYGTAASLGMLAARPGVRAVEAVPNTSVPGGFEPPLPEQTATVQAPTVQAASLPGD